VRRVALLLVQVVVFGILVPAAHGQIPSGDSVIGQGRTAPFGDLLVVQVFDLEARSGPSGEDPSGYVTLEVGALAISPSFLHYEGPVRCLSVSGNDALVGFELHPPFDIYPGAVIEVEDNGPPGSDPPDFFRARVVADPSSCTPSGFPVLPEVAEGDVAVIDAPPQPTSKSECEKGGYERFGFKNQGGCVAFVQRGPK
jgi:hypothetical protein